MKKFSATCSLFLFLLVISGLSTTTLATTICEYISVQGGGCPDLNACGNTCASCYKGVGKVIGACLSKGSGQPDDECRCYFTEGAPCIPDCATPPAVPLDTFTAKTYNNGTHVVITS